ncbi:hypothetical protein [Methylobacterium radiodurans]|uniref:Uncharacterized protein n=1 Tax=Methylobacterium radiodurans TaxID=2202828 RepID=A0A2U8VU04_9HYPH|nr:hypothetical protein [Methylobacterium radiodurans]AWN37165.1 hypothetical protein DK427_16685 [Methylobacterium radiodurans]
MIEILATDLEDLHLRPDEARFKALLDLEVQARTHGACDATLRVISQVRVMAGAYVTRMAELLDQGCRPGAPGTTAGRDIGHTL